MTQHTGKGHVPGERLREILDALGMAPTRDWDDVLNAARCLHKNASGDAVAPGEQPDDEVGRLRSVLAGRERELKAALTQVHELRTAADTGQADEPVITFDDEVAWLGRRYVAALNAVLCAPPGSNDVDRWRGHAEAFRQVAEQICRDLNRPAPPFGREEWRAANGIYSEEYLAELREIVRRSAGPSGDTVQAPAADIAGWGGAS